MNDITKLIEFIRTLYPGRDVVPLHAPLFGQREKELVLDCVESTFVSSVGKYVDRFEDMTARFTGARRAVACVNGTAALHMALVVAGVRPGDMVVTQAVSFIATANAIRHAGAEPAFVDSDSDTLGMSPEALRRFLADECLPGAHGPQHKASGRRIAAVTPMHVFGHACRIAEIARICDEYEIALVEDAAEALGTRIDTPAGPRHAGTFGRCGVLSYNGNKTITTGGGGMILTDDDRLADLAKHLTTTGKVPHRWEYRHDAVAWNYRLPNLNAALGCAQMEALPALLADKRAVARAYADFFRDSELTFVTEPRGCRSNYWLCAVLLPDAAQRDELLQRTNGAGVMTRPLWGLMPEQPMYRDCPCGPLGAAHAIRDRLVNLPSGPRSDAERNA